MRFLVATVFFYILQVQLYQTLSIYAAESLHLGPAADRPALLAERADGGVPPDAGGRLHPAHRTPARALVLGCLGYAASYAAVGLATGYVTLLVCVGFVTFAEIVTAPAQQTAITAMAPAARVGV